MSRTQPLRFASIALLAASLVFGACSDSGDDPGADGGQRPDGAMDLAEQDGPPVADVALNDGGEVTYSERSCDTTFRYTPKEAVAEVALIGEWDWSKKPKLQDPDGDGTYELTLTLPKGSWAYRFVQRRSAGGAEEFLLDPENPYRRYHGGVGRAGAADLLRGDQPRRCL